jgi:hypothetical protein
MSEKITFEQLQEKGNQIPKENIDRKPNGPDYQKPGQKLRPRPPHLPNQGIPNNLNTLDSEKAKTPEGRKYLSEVNKINDSSRAERELKEAGVLKPFDADRTGLDYNNSNPLVQKKMSELRQDLHQYQTQQTLENVTSISPFVIGAAGAALLYKKLKKPKIK